MDREAAQRAAALQEVVQSEASREAARTAAQPVLPFTERVSAAEIRQLCGKIDQQLDMFRGHADTCAAAPYQVAAAAMGATAAAVATSNIIITAALATLEKTSLIVDAFKELNHPWAARLHDIETIWYCESLRTPQLYRYGHVLLGKATVWWGRVGPASGKVASFVSATRMLSAVERELGKRASLKEME